ncbi:hypothetical protein [Bacillus sp. Marseille-P3800]|uniref:hypothetical protein n=1 Tax=Bacillus sp. Marseille-P3800 TaxID=2014782 RepID=UPI000C077D87|nr:hypothetical protein [Bacillus sp. Marseille-P3800]
MTLPTSKLVEYWYNQQGFFTIKGEGDNFDLLAVQNQNGKDWRFIHCEIRIQDNDLFLLSPPLYGKTIPSTPSSQVDRWLQDTFTSFKRRAAREKLVPNVEWDYHLIYGNRINQDELDLLSTKGVKIIPLSKIVLEVKEHV